MFILREQLSDKVIRNTLFNFTRLLISFPVTIFLTPYILHRIGIEAYGVWALTLALASYVNLLDLGINAAITKYVAEYNIKHKISSINRTVNTALVVYLILGTISFLVFLVLKNWLFINFYRVALLSKSDLEFVFIGSILIFSFNFIFSVYPSILSGLQRMDLTNTINIFSTFINAFVIVITLIAGLGIKGLVIANIIAAIFIVGSSIFCVKKICPGVIFSFRFFEKREIRKLLTFSLQIKFVGFATLVHTQFDKFLISYFLGINYVTYYDIAGRILNYFRSLGSAFLDPIMPAASELFALEKHLKIRELYYRSQKYLIFLTFPIASFVAILARPLIFLWLGRDYSLVAITIQILILANFINLLTGPGFYIFSGIGKVKYGMYSSILGIFLNILFSFIFIIILGYKGAVIGTASALILASIWFIYIFHRVEVIHFKETFLAAISKPAFASIIFSLFLFLNLYFLPEPGFFALLVLGLLSIIIYLSVVFKFHFLDSYEIEKVKLYFSSFWHRNAQ